MIPAVFKAMVDVLKDEAKNTNYIKLVSLYNSKIKPVLGEEKMKTLSKKRVELFLNSISQNCCETVLKDCYVLLKKMYTYYSKPNGPEFNIMNKVKCPESQKEKKEKRGYTPEEIERIFSVADGINPETNRPKYMHGNAVKLMLLTNMKIGEALALTWSDVDFKNSTITVNKTSSEINLSEDGKTDYSIKFKPLSDNRTRIIPITPEVHLILVSIRNSNPNANFVIAQRNGDPVSKSYISRVMRECVKGACG
jgi:integrase